MPTGNASGSAIGANIASTPQPNTTAAASANGLSKALSLGFVAFLLLMVALLLSEGKLGAHLVQGAIVLALIAVVLGNEKHIEPILTVIGESL